MIHPLKIADSNRIVRWTNPDQLHLTLVFMGSVEKDELILLRQSLERLANEWEAFEMKVRGWGGFPTGRHPRVIWVGVDGERDRLRELQSRIVETVKGTGDPQETNPFSPHLTLGRIKKPDPGFSVQWAQFCEKNPILNCSPWKVTTFHLMQSELQSTGAIHRTVASFEWGSTN